MAVFFSGCTNPGHFRIPTKEVLVVAEKHAASFGVNQEDADARRGRGREGKMTVILNENTADMQVPRPPTETSEKRSSTQSVGFGQSILLGSLPLPSQGPFLLVLAPFSRHVAASSEQPPRVSKYRSFAAARVMLTEGNPESRTPPSSTPG